MSATESGAKHGQEEPLDLVQVFQSLHNTFRFVGEEKRLGLISALLKANEAFQKGMPFDVQFLQARTFAEFLDLPNRNQGLFNQLESETKWWDLLDQIEEICFGNANPTGHARQFIRNLWAEQDKVVANPYQPPKDWRYAPVPEAVERLRKIFGSSLKADGVLKLAKEAKPRKESEGVPTWIKLTTLAKLFGLPGNPLDSMPEGMEAYAGVANPFITQVGEQWFKANPALDGFTNWREGALSANHNILTPACRKTWQELEAMTDDDFVIAPFGAVSGSRYVGHSQRRSRLQIVLADDEFPQDCVMTGATILVQPERLCEDSHLRPECPGNAYSPAADGQFWDSVFWFFDDRGLRFGSDIAHRASRGWGSACGFRS